MKDILRKCPNCKRYTMNSLCDHCGTKTIVAHPPRFSIDDKYILYRVPQSYSS